MIVSSVKYWRITSAALILLHRSSVVTPLPPFASTPFTRRGPRRQISRRTEDQLRNGECCVAVAAVPLDLVGVRHAESVERAVDVLEGRVRRSASPGDVHLRRVDVEVLEAVVHEKRSSSITGVVRNVM